MEKWLFGVALLATVAVMLSSTSSAEFVQHQLGGISGVIKSPNYPSTYPENQNISWTIRVRPGFRIVLYFTEFEIEDSYDKELGGACVYDYVEVKDAENQMYKSCGNSSSYSHDAPRIQQEFFSSSNELTVNFVSDYSNEDPIPVGFKAHYKEIDRDECVELKRKAARALEDWDTLLYCNQHCHNVPATYYCSCDPGFKLHENKHTCTNDCAEKELTAPTGIITTSRYPEKYSKLAECNWKIQQKEGISIELRFVGEFSIEKHVDEGCVYDWVQYDDVNGKKSNKSCGPELPNSGKWISTNSYVINVMFQSDLTIEEAGFKLEYRTIRVKCRKRIRAPKNGLITSKIKKYEFEDIVTFQCNKGYRLTGQQSITCKSDGTWSAETPSCRIKSCKKPMHLQTAKNGRIKEDNFELVYGSEVTFWCYTWYEMTSGTSVWRCEDDEEWHEASEPVANNANRNIPECEPICGLKGNEKILNGSYDFGDVLPNIEDAEPLLTSQIIRGQKAKEAEWPWMAFVDLHGYGIEADEFCGGNLLSPTTVLTAAHCMQSALRSQIRVFVGVTDRGARTEYMQEFTVSEVIQHENYSTTSMFANDLAVLKLNASVKIGKYARPICLPRADREKELPDKAAVEEEGYQKTGIVAGWGITESKFVSYELMEARVPPINHGKCKKHLESKKDERLAVSKNMLCAGFLDGAKDSCKGDSGGPYMFRDNVRRRWYLNGIVSFGSATRDCGDHTFGIYANVAKYVDWLEAFLTD